MNKSENILLLSAEKIHVIHDLAHAIWPDTFKNILSKEQIDFMLEWMYNPETLRKQVDSGHLFYLFLQEDTPIGFMGLELNFPFPGQMKLHKIYVLPQTQGSGIGRKLLQKALDLAKEKGMQSLVLNVNRFNTAVGFYEHLGFQIIGEEDIDIGNGFWMEDFVMRYDLKTENNFF